MVVGRQFFPIGFRQLLGGYVKLGGYDLLENSDVNHVFFVVQKKTLTEALYLM